MSKNGANPRNSNFLPTPQPEPIINFDRPRITETLTQSEEIRRLKMSTEILHKELEQM
jgi:hypothetical protein